MKRYEKQPNKRHGVPLLDSVCYMLQAAQVGPHSARRGNEDAGFMGKSYQHHKDGEALLEGNRANDAFNIH